MSFNEQLEAINWEVTDGKYKHVGAKLKSGSHEGGRAAAIIDRDYESPANPESLELLREDAKRAANARLAMRGYDPGAQRMSADARAGSAGDSSDTTAAASAQARLAHRKIEILHSNAPPGTTTQISHDSPGYIDVVGPRTMGAMPTTGTPRNVARDGY